VQREPSSHKGENGKVAVIGGSRFIHGAPLFAALAAEASGADLVFVCLPACHEEAAKVASLNFQVHPFRGDDLREKDTEEILKLLATMDSAVIGPGIAYADAESMKAIRDIVAEAPCALVLDAGALQPETVSLLKDKTAVLTPHRAELERMRIDVDDLTECAANARVTIVLKGPTDCIANPEGEIMEITGGNAGLTVGGTGDALAGLIAGLLAQGVDQEDAARIACEVLKRAAGELFPEYGYAFGTGRVIGEVSRILHALTDE
jgi:NAD(P)H-hydrate epimerase